MKLREFIYLCATLLPLPAFSAVQVTPVHSIQDIPTNKPTAGHYRLHLIDVGTGLSILIQGHDWNYLIDVDILLVEHHGSLTSSRTAFVNAVSPDIALISAGPKKYHKIVLPDQAVVESLNFQGIHILRTDLYDGDTCPVKNKVGRDDDRSGGCTNFILEW